MLQARKGIATILFLNSSDASPATELFWTLRGGTGRGTRTVLRHRSSVLPTFCCCYISGVSVDVSFVGALHTGDTSHLRSSTILVSFLLCRSGGMKNMSRLHTHSLGVLWPGSTQALCAYHTTHLAAPCVLLPLSPACLPFCTCPTYAWQDFLPWEHAATSFILVLHGDGGGGGRLVAGLWLFER